MALELYSQQYWTPDAVLAPGVAFQVFPDNNNVFAPLFADAAGTIPIPNPGVTDGAGFITFYAAAGDYWIHLDTETFRVSLPPPDLGPFLPLSGGTVTGDLVVVTDDTTVNVGNGFGETLSTGLTSGGSMSGIGTNQLSFGPLTGYIVDATTNPANPSVKFVSMPAQVVPIVGVVATRALNWWLVDEFGVISALPTIPSAQDRRERIQIGATGSDIGTGILSNVQPAPVPLDNPVNQSMDVMFDLGPFSVSGNQLAPNGSNLRIDKAVGDMFAPSFGYPLNPKSPHHVTSPAESPVQFSYATQIAGSQGPLTTFLDPTNYDVGGVITPVPGPASISTIQRVFLFGTGNAGLQTIIQYGQAIYSSQATALQNVGSLDFIVIPDNLGIATLIGYVVMTKSATDLSDPAQATFVRAGKFQVS